MNQRKICFLILAFCGLLFQDFEAMAQDIRTDDLRLYRSGNTIFYQEKKKLKEETINPQLLYEDFIKANVILISGKVLDSLFINYDILNTSVVVSRDWAPLHIPLRQVIELSLIENGEQYLNSNALNIPGEERLLKVLMDTTDYTLYQWYSVHETTNSSNLREVNRLKKYVMTWKSNQETRSFKSVNALIKSLDGSKDLKKYIKEEQLELKNDGDLIKLLNYYISDRSN